MTWSSATGISGCEAESGLGSLSRMALRTLIWLLPANARLPLTISYSTAPNAKMSVRASASFPSTCSGAMYWYVPTILPSAVNGLLMVFTDADVIAAIPPVGFANPKSSSFAPDLVNIMFPGFRSRCTMPFLWAFSSASAISIPRSSTCFTGNGPLSRRWARVCPSRSSITK